ncbi:MAG TPA: hypothetical protein GXX35_01455 [Thermoanaerobacterales bacterium]|nr:hypothetical protein [Thermoanaerobacterales bacterium]
MRNLFAGTEGSIKLFSAIIYVAIVATLRAWPYLIWCLILYFLLLLILRFPGYKNIRQLIPPLLFIAAMSAGIMLIDLKAGKSIDRGLVIFLRALNAIYVLNTVISSMTLQELLSSMRSLRLPEIMVNLVGFTLRYSDILSREMNRMMTARKARGYVPHKSMWHSSTMKVLGQTVGVLFIRSYERSERVYQAMLARGYGGSVIPVGGRKRLQKMDYIVGLSIILIPLTLKMAELGVLSWILP